MTNGSTVSMAICACLTLGARTPVTVADGQRNLMESRGEREPTKDSDTWRSRKSERKRGPVAMVEMMCAHAIEQCSVARMAKPGSGADGPPGRAEDNSAADTSTSPFAQIRSRSRSLQSPGDRLRGIPPGMITKCHQDFIVKYCSGYAGESRVMKNPSWMIFSG